MRFTWSSILYAVAGGTWISPRFPGSGLLRYSRSSSCLWASHAWTIRSRSESFLCQVEWIREWKNGPDLNLCSMYFWFLMAWCLFRVSDYSHVVCSISRGKRLRLAKAVTSLYYPMSCLYLNSLLYKPGIQNTCQRGYSKPKSFSSINFGRMVVVPEVF